MKIIFIVFFTIAFYFLCLFSIYVVNKKDGNGDWWGK